MSDPQASNAEMALRWIQHGMRHREQKQWTEALESFEKAISLEPRNPQAWALKGRALDEMNNLSEAIRCYKVSLDINPSSASTWNNKGYAFRKQQKYSHALECYREAVRLQPTYAKAWYNMGYVLDKQGNYEAAIEAFDRAIEISPDNDKYVTSRKAVVATWTEFQKVFENPNSSLSSSSSTPVPSSTTSISSGGARTSREFSPSMVQSVINGPAPSGIRESREFTTSNTAPTPNSSNTRDTHVSSTALSTSEGSHTDPTTFNPFLDFEASESTPNGSRRVTQAQSQLSQHQVVITDASPSTSPIISSTSELNLGSSHSDTMAVTMQSSASRSSIDEAILHYAYVPSNASAVQSLDARRSLDDHRHSSHNGQLYHHPQHRELSQLREHHQHHLRHGSSSSSSPNLHHMPQLHSHHSHNSNQSGSSSGIMQKQGPKKEKRSSGERPHSVSVMTRTPESDTLAGSSSSSGSSTGSLNADHINQANASINASAPTISPPMVHSRSMSSATTSARSNHNPGLSPTSASEIQQNISSSLQQPHQHQQALHSSSGQAESNTGDTESLLNTLHLSLQAVSLQRGEGSSSGPMTGTPTSYQGSNPGSALLGSPDGSDGEHDVHVGPRAQTYLEAIYTHLQGVKSVRDAEKLEIALEEMLAAVRVKRNFLASKASSSASENEDKCSICWERPPEMVCIPCGHLCICEHCKSQLRTKKCPICGQAVKNIYKVFK